MVSIAKMREQLLEGFPEPQADLMARVFVSAHDELVTKAELNELTAVVRELAEIQGRTEWAVRDDIRPLFFGYKAERRARELIVASGAAMVFTRGVMIPAPSGNPPVTP